MKRVVQQSIVLAAIIFALVICFGASRAASSASLESYSLAAQRSAAAIYKSQCASCHGKDGRAKTFKAKFNHARNLADAEWQERTTDERIFNSISNGRGKMPAYGNKLSDAEIESLVAYVRGLRK